MFCFKKIVACLNYPCSYFNKDPRFKCEFSFFFSLGPYIFSESKQVIWYLYWVLIIYVKWCSGGVESDREETREERLGFWGRSLQRRRRELESFGWKERLWEQCDMWLHLQPQFLLPCCEHVLLSSLFLFPHSICSLC